MANEQEIATVVRTLLSSGFLITNVQRKPNYLAISAKRFDEFGIAAEYLFGYAGDQMLSAADCAALSKVAKYNGAALIAVGRGTGDGEMCVISREDLFGKLGGAITSNLPLE